MGNLLMSFTAETSAVAWGFNIIIIIIGIIVYKIRDLYEYKNDDTQLRYFQRKIEDKNDEIDELLEVNKRLKSKLRKCKKKLNLLKDRGQKV
jgi:adenylosuccinate synthase